VTKGTNVMQGEVVSVYVGVSGTLDKARDQRIEFMLDGIVGDRHRGMGRKTWESTDKQPGGTERRNERQWSAIAYEDLQAISEEMELARPLTAGSIAVNLCLKGIPNFSKLPRGTVLQFSSGVVLIVEEYNPPCSRMSNYLAKQFVTRSGSNLSQSAFIDAAKFRRGLVGVVEVSGAVAAGDTVTVAPEILPKWLRDT